MEHFHKFYIYSKTLRCIYPSDNTAKNVSKWVEGKVVENNVYNVHVNFNNAIMQKHVDQFGYMANTNGINKKIA